MSGFSSAWFRAKCFLAGILGILVLPLEALDPMSFYLLLSEPTPPWMHEQIAHDLEPFEKELSRKALDKLFADDAICGVRVRVVNGNLIVQRSPSAETHATANSIIPHLYQLHDILPLPEIDFIFTSHDVLPCHHMCSTWSDFPNVPVFVTSKCRLHAGNILMPDWFALKDYQPEKVLVLEGNNAYPWDTKQKILFFRGSDTGAFDWNSWSSWPRPKLVALSVKHPDLVDAKFALSLHNRAMIETAKREGYISDYVSMRENQRYRYLMDIDGNCASCPRTALLLHSNSVVLKQMTYSTQWFYRTLKPYVHFIPVAEDVSDLLTQIEWAKNHDAECKQISENARQLAQDVLTVERIYQYFYLLLQEYSKKQKPIYDLE